MARPAFGIRPGTPRDAAAIVMLIRELARYERLLPEVKITPAQVRRHGFGPRAYFQTLICRSGGRPVGLALYFFTYSSFLGKPILWLEDLVVLPGERGRGAGKALLRALARIAVARGCGRMEWSVLDWNAPAIRFYRRIGARLDKEWIITRLKDAPLRRLARSSRAR